MIIVRLNLRLPKALLKREVRRWENGTVLGKVGKGYSGTWENARNQCL